MGGVFYICHAQTDVGTGTGIYRYQLAALVHAFYFDDLYLMTFDFIDLFLKRMIKNARDYEKFDKIVMRMSCSIHACFHQYCDIIIFNGHSIVYCTWVGKNPHAYYKVQSRHFTKLIFIVV